MRRTLTAVTAAALLAGAVLAGQNSLTAQTTSTTEPERTDWAHLPVWTSMYGHVAGENDEMVVFAWPHSFSADPAGRLPSDLRVNRIRVDQRRLHIDTSSRLTGIDSLEGALLRFTHATNGKSHEMALADAVEHDDGEWDLIWPEVNPLPITEAGRWTIELDYPDSYRTVVWETSGVIPWKDNVGSYVYFYAGGRGQNALPPIPGRGSYGHASFSPQVYLSASTVRFSSYSDYPYRSYRNYPYRHPWPGGTLRFWSERAPGTVYEFPLSTKSSWNYGSWDQADWSWTWPGDSSRGFDLSTRWTIQLTAFGSPPEPPATTTTSTSTTSTTTTTLPPQVIEQPPVTITPDQ